MASETTFDHWKVVFSWGKMRKSRFSQNPLNARFWAFGFLIYTSSSTNFKENPPWYIFFVSVHVPVTRDTYKLFKRKAPGYQVPHIAINFFQLESFSCRAVIDTMFSFCKKKKVISFVKRKSVVSGIHTWARQRSPMLLLFQNQALLPEAHLGPGRRKN